MFKEYMDRIARAAGDIEVTRGGARVKMDPDKAIRDVSKKIRGIKRSGGKVMIVGNGGSASIASHQTIDLWKNCGVKAMSFNEGATLTCLSNDLGYEKVFERPVAFFAERGDCLIAISSSGMSKN
jgi:phosphoheptose isomerase